MACSSNHPALAGTPPEEGEPALAVQWYRRAAVAGTPPEEGEPALTPAAEEVLLAEARERYKDLLNPADPYRDVRLHGCRC